MKKNRWVALTLIGISVFFSLSLWFSTSVIETELKTKWHLTPAMESWLSIAIPIGFVIGAFISSFLGLADRYNTRKFFAISALTGGLLNGVLIFVDQGHVGIMFRIFIGMTLAGVYPPAVKLISQWFPSQRGVATGILIAALTLGTSLPHFISLLVTFLNGNVVLLLCTVLAIMAAIIMNYALGDGPGSSNDTSFSLGQLKKIFRNKPVMLANYGYFGHMWELYGMWTWLPAFLTASFIAYSPSTDPWISTLVAFGSIGVAGGLGCVIGGVVSDKIGRSNLTISAMTISALCAIFIGFTFGLYFWLTILLALIWGMSVVADSAQFSAAVSDFSEVKSTGTALTFQMCIGYLITIGSINLIPLFKDFIGWEWVFTTLSVGPIIGIIAMSKFKEYEK
ncbi:MFS transporter [Staphylococcus nepalensis]|uniref:MFS transporter n=1 Tax=Staphylococcus nepalensis TaxID=214473 RepID=A0ABS3L498_9STAP|nr:MFS transporter [Staphylococcus nepalensis]MBO1212183.1 MFS transporter [Staphylococcus nepalensis]MBO1217567.1 MFS transporter [Staphylococcus nepalensis]MBO1228380.1 MFS transporter [Staphylococcus nepalensis]MBO1235442.1 MFS transporter [Staphylococcus nepalensis]MBO1238642.1 MFS transporter [Staphylococcus nepalensis]